MILAAISFMMSAAEIEVALFLHTIKDPNQRSLERQTDIKYNRYVINILHTE